MWVLGEHVRVQLTKRSELHKLAVIPRQSGAGLHNLQMLGFLSTINKLIVEKCPRLF